VADPATVDPRFLLDDRRANIIEQVVGQWWPEQIDPADVGNQTLATTVITARARLLEALDLSALS
jgi:succinylarginine dihydrolase